MRNSRCAFNTTTALFRIFIAPTERPKLKSLRNSSLQPLPQRLGASKLLFFWPQTRNYAAKAEKSRLPRDEEIKSWTVCLVSADGGLEQARSTANILSSIDRKTHSLVTVAEGEPGSPPICKILNKKAMRDAEKAKILAAKKGTITTKTIELNWAIDGNDLGHRLSRIRDFLAKGNRVEVMMAPKRKGRKASEEEAKALTDRVRKVIEECEARESKPMEGRMLGTATIYAEGKR